MIESDEEEEKTRMRRKSFGAKEVKMGRLGWVIGWLTAGSLYYLFGGRGKSRTAEAWTAKKLDLLSSSKEQRQSLTKLLWG